MDVIGRCEAPGCDRSARLHLEVLGPPADRAGVVCPRHATHTELGALLMGCTVVTPRTRRARRDA